MAIVKTCTRCAETQREALFWTVGAWQRADGVRVAYKHKLCLTCVSARIAPLQVHSDEQGMTCPNCGIDTSQDFDAVYLSWIPRGVGTLQAECPFCAACAAIWRSWFITGAEELEDRNRVVEGRPDAPRYEANQVLAALGIRPRA
jgi:hypothetical protein